MHKKGFAIAQVFIYIIVILTFALIMIFGYRAVTQFVEKGEDVALVQFKTDLEESIQKIYTEYGSVRVKSYSVPAEFESICFVDIDYLATPADISALCAQNQAACLAWEDKATYDTVEENVFLSPRADVKIKVHTISISPNEATKGFLCIPISRGSFSLVLEGKGDLTQIGSSTQ